MPSRVNPANEIEEEKILTTALEEVRIKYRSLEDDYTNLGSKIFTLIATELVITTFLFTFKVNDSKPLFSLENIATFIFFGIGLASIIIALGVLFWATTSNKWASPAELKELQGLNYRTHIDFLTETKNDYIEAFKFCSGRYKQRRIVFDWSVILFVIGVIMLMVIKIGG